jgi:hypothetical protein
MGQQLPMLITNSMPCSESDVQASLCLSMNQSTPALLFALPDLLVTNTSTVTTQLGQAEASVVRPTVARCNCQNGEQTSLQQEARKGICNLK